MSMPIVGKARKPVNAPCASSDASTAATARRRAVDHPRCGAARRRVDGDRQPHARRARARRRGDPRERCIAAIARDRLHAERHGPQPPRPLDQDGARAPPRHRQLVLHADPQRHRGGAVRGRLRHGHGRHPRRPRPRGALRPPRPLRPGRRRAAVRRAASRTRTSPTSTARCRSPSSATTSPSLDSLPVFEIDNRDAARRMVDYLVSVGHRRIGHVTGPRRQRRGRASALVGYRDGTGRRRPRRRRQHRSGRAPSRVEAGVARRPPLPRPSPTGRPRSSPPTTRCAIGFIKTVAMPGFAFPSDVSVVGFDDIEYRRALRAGADHHAPAARRTRPPRRRDAAGADDRNRQRAVAHPPALHAGRSRQRLPAALTGAASDRRRQPRRHGLRVQPAVAHSTAAMAT